MKIEALARKYRPKIFDDVVGQDNIIKILKNTIKNNHIYNSYLFTGSRGIGKTTTARIFARAINCENSRSDGNPCNECEICKNKNLLFEIDAASNNSVEDIRNIIEQIRYAPIYHKYTVYVIDEVHMLSQAAFNTFLKTLEEPPQYVVFILATTERHKILPTILSRCQIFQFKPITPNTIVNNISKILDNENINYDKESLHLIAKYSDGSMRDALSLLDSIRNYNNDVSNESVAKILNIIDNKLYKQIINDVSNKHLGDAILLLNNIINSGYDPYQFILGLLDYCRNILIASNTNTYDLLFCGENDKNEYIQQANQFDISYICQIIKIINEWTLYYKDSLNKRFYVETLLVSLSLIDKNDKNDNQLDIKYNVKKNHDQDDKEENCVQKGIESKINKNNIDKDTNITKNSKIVRDINNIINGMIIEAQNFNSNDDNNVMEKQSFDSVLEKFSNIKYMKDLLQLDLI